MGGETLAKVTKEAAVEVSLATEKGADMRED